MYFSLYNKAAHPLAARQQIHLLYIIPSTRDSYTHLGVVSSLSTSIRAARYRRDFGPPSAEAALLALERASSSEPSGVPEDMAFLIELVQGSKSRAERWRQASALMGLRSILLCKHQAVRIIYGLSGNGGARKKKKKR